MKILIFSHSSSTGGAETALLHLIEDLRRLNHELEVIVPAAHGEMTAWLSQRQIPIYTFPIGFSLPLLANHLLRLSAIDLAAMAEPLQTQAYDLILCNTMVCILGALLAQQLQLPCITYVHEVPSANDLQPHGCSSAYYLRWLQALSPNLLCASDFVARQFSDSAHKTVLWPFSGLTAQQASETSHEFALLVIGTRSLRKNSHFALTVLKSLRLRGRALRLHVIGSDNSGSEPFQRLHALRAERGVVLHPQRPDWHDLPGRKINLICAQSEPFGLTIPESLSRGIPCVATRSGGPQETLPQDYLYDVDDLDRCVRIIEAIMDGYEQHCAHAHALFADLNARNSQPIRAAILRDFLAHLRPMSQAEASSALISLAQFRHLSAPPVGIEQMLESCLGVACGLGMDMNRSDLLHAIEQEKHNPGSAMLADVRAFDVVPFAFSDRMAQLRAQGWGRAIEQMAHRDDPEKTALLAFIVLGLTERRTQQGRRLKILCQGDALGMDAITLSACGHDVDCIDFDASLPGKVAQHLCAGLRSQSTLSGRIRFLPQPELDYDAAVTLDVIENEPQPDAWAASIHDVLAPDGLWYVSERFDGIDDRWPTHLLSNERSAARLPLSLLAHFTLIDINPSPANKPYVFQKRSSPVTTVELNRLLQNRVFNSSYLHTLQRTGF